MLHCTYDTGVREQGARLKELIPNSVQPVRQLAPCLTCRPVELMAEARWNAVGGELDITIYFMRLTMTCI